MQCFCKSISSSSSTSAVLPITSNAYTACRIVGFQRLLSSCRECHNLVTPRGYCGDGRLLRSPEPNPLRVRAGLHSIFTFKVSAVAHHSFISTRGLKSAPKKNALGNRSPSPKTRPSSKKGDASAIKESSVKPKASFKPLQGQKSTFTKQKEAEARKSLRPVQAQSRGSTRPAKVKTQRPSNVSRSKAKPSFARGQPARAKAEGSSSQVQKQFVMNESTEEEDLDEDFTDDDDDEESLDSEEEDFDEEGEDFDVEEDDEIEEEGVDDDELTKEDDAFIDDMLDEEGEGTDEVMIGDGGDGGGVKLSTSNWGEKALLIAKGVLHEFGDNFSLYAFKTSFENRIFVRLDKHSDRYGSPSIVEIESFSSIYGKRLEEAGQAGDVPENLALEVSSPGAERVVEVPDQLLRFKDLPMFVRYEETRENENKTSPTVKDNILQIETIEAASGKSVWKLANVRANREQTGKFKGKSLNKTQKEWRVEIPFSALRLVRLYMDI